MNGHKRRCAAIEDVKRGAGAGVDLEEKSVSPIHQEIGGGQALDLEGEGELLDGGRHLARDGRSQVGWADRAAIAPKTRRRGCRPLLAETKHARVAHIGDEKDRYRTSHDKLLIIDVRRVPLEPARDDMAAARATSLLGEPASAPRGRVDHRCRMKNAETVERYEEALRRLKPPDGRGGVAEQRPTFRDRRQQLGTIFEARAIDQSENGGGRELRQTFERAQETPPAHSAADAAVKFAAGKCQVLCIGIGEEIGDERREPGAPRRRRKRPSRDACNQDRSAFSLRASEQGRMRPGNRDKEAFRFRSSARTVRLRSGI